MSPLWNVQPSPHPPPPFLAKRKHSSGRLFDKIQILLYWPLGISNPPCSCRFPEEEKENEEVPLLWTADSDQSSVVKLVAPKTELNQAALVWNSVGCQLHRWVSAAFYCTMSRQTKDSCDIWFWMASSTARYILQLLHSLAIHLRTREFHVKFLFKSVLCVKSYVNSLVMKQWSFSKYRVTYNFRNVINIQKRNVWVGCGAAQVNSLMSSFKDRRCWSLWKQQQPK